MKDEKIFHDHPLKKDDVTEKPDEIETDSKNSNKASEEKLPEANASWMEKIENFPCLTKEEEINLIRKIQKGDPCAERQFIEANLKLVVFVAKNYTNRGIDFEDLIQEGNFCLIKIIPKFDPKKGRFSTYAVKTLQDNFQKLSIRKSKPINVPTWVTDGQYKVKKYICEHFLEHGKEPSLEEISQATKESITHIKHFIKAQQINVVSYDNPITEGEEHQLIDLIPDISESLEEIALAKIKNAEIMQAIKKLPQRDREILCYYYGLGGQSHTYKETASAFHVCYQKIQQIIDRCHKELFEYLKDQEF